MRAQKQGRYEVFVIVTKLHNETSETRFLYDYSTGNGLYFLHKIYGS